MRISDWSSDVCSSDLQLVARDPVATGNGFGREVRDALDARASHLETQGLAPRQGLRVILAQDLVGALKNQELTAATQAIAARTALVPKPSRAGDYLSRIYRARVPPSPALFPMTDEGLAFQLVTLRTAAAHTPRQPTPVPIHPDRP